MVASPKKRVVHCYEKTYTHNSTFYFKIIHQKTYSSPPKMSNPVEKNLNMKKNKVRGSVLRLLDADFKILEKWITGSIFLILEKMFLSCCRFLGYNPGTFFCL